MYSFDEKWRRRLLKDALVADLLDAQAGGQASPDARAPRPGVATRVEAATTGRTRDARSAA